MPENISQEDTGREKVTKRPHTLQSEFALTDLNDWLKNTVITKRAVTYLEQEEVRISLTHNDAMWKANHTALTDKKKDLKDLKNAVKAAWDNYQACLKLEEEGKWLE